MVSVIAKARPFLSTEACALPSRLRRSERCVPERQPRAVFRQRAEEGNHCPRIDDPGRQQPLEAMKIDDNTAPFQLGRGREIRSPDKVSGNSAGAQEANNLAL